MMRYLSQFNLLRPWTGRVAQHCQVDPKSHGTTPLPTFNQQSPHFDLNIDWWTRRLCTLRINLWALGVGLGVSWAQKQDIREGVYVAGNLLPDHQSVNRILLGTIVDNGEGHTI